MEYFQNKSLLITGGATGLGAAVAEAAAQCGARVAILDVNESDGRAVAQRVGGNFWKLDVGDQAQWKAVIPQIADRLGPIHFAHLNAGIMTKPLDVALSTPPITDFDMGRYADLMRVNVDGVVFGMQGLIPIMLEQGMGAITVTSSMGGLGAIRFDPVYSATKHALIGLIRSLGAAYPDAPIRFSAICPGGFTSGLFPPELHGSDSLTPQDVALELLDMLQHAATGETRLLLKRGEKAQIL